MEFRIIIFLNADNNLYEIYVPLYKYNAISKIF